MEIMDINSNVPKDYSLSTLEMCNKSEITEVPMSKSMKLNFGVERLLAHCEKNERNSPRNFASHQISDNVETNQMDNHMGLNLLHQQLIHSTDGNLFKPFPLRFGSNHNRYSHQPPSYFQSNRKVPMTSNMNMYPTSISTMNTYHNILRLPSLPQLSPNNESASLFNNLKKDCEKGAINSNGSSNVKRKRSWSRAVFSNLQRKGLERQFEFQKYITKPDRKKLAARLGLKDAQVKVWFQNRRMKWRHSTRSATTVKGKTNSQENSDVNDDDQFSSSEDDDADVEIDVVTDH